MATAGDSPSARAWCGLAALACWFVRYAVHQPWDGWTVGIRTEDWRYGEVAKVTGSGTFAFWLLSFTSLHQTPSLLVWFALGAAHAVWSGGATRAPPLGGWDVFAFGTLALAILVQASADGDLRSFRRRVYGASANLMTASGSKQVYIFIY